MLGMGRTTDLHTLQADDHDSWTRLARQARENRQAWEATTDEQREAYAAYYLDHPGRDPQARTMGEAPPLSPAAWLAQQEVTGSGNPPWHLAAEDLAIERAAAPRDQRLEDVLGLDVGKGDSGAAG